jgi:chorismate-pyruvate lyase
MAIMFAASPDIHEAKDRIPPWAALLQLFYARAGVPLRQFQELKGEEVPPPYKKLLVHSSDMTPTLEAFFQQPMSLTVLSRDIQADSYLREVTLNQGNGGRPVEYGAIRISLAQLPANARRIVLEEERPLGNILQGEAIPHLSWPQAFFSVQSDSRMSTVLGLRQPARLYGRRNVLVDVSRRLLAEVIEVLAPVEQPETGSKS